MKKFLKLTATMLILALVLACSKTSDALYKAGTYTATATGYGGDLTLKVNFTANEITTIEIVEHSEAAGINDGAINDLPRAIVKVQSTDVDIVAGASVSSKAILTAAENAITQAKNRVGELTDGVYTGTARGHRGNITLKVTFQTGKIASIKVLEHREDPGIGEKAIRKLPAAIVKSGATDVDTVAGATVSSKALIRAVEDTIMQAKTAPKGDN